MFMRVKYLMEKNGYNAIIGPSDEVIPELVTWDRMVTIDAHAGKMRVGILEPRSGPIADILMIHGWSSGGKIWGLVAQKLAFYGFRVVCPDLPGHGVSDAPEDISYDYELFSHYIDLLLHELGLDKFIIAGHSMGGAIALNFASQNKDKITGMVLLSTALRFWQKLPPFITKLLPDEFLSLSKEALLKAYVALWNAPNTDQWLKRRVAEVALQTPPHVMKSTYENIVLRWDGREIARTLYIPALVGGGTLDIVTPPSLVMKVAQTLPFGVYRKFPRASHHLTVDFPEELAELINAFSPALIKE